MSKYKLVATKGYGGAIYMVNEMDYHFNDEDTFEKVGSYLDKEGKEMAIVHKMGTVPFAVKPEFLVKVEG